jgi:four helix bundle protein
MATDTQNYGFRFRDWDIYKDARVFRASVNVFLRDYPKEEKYALVDQTKRALNSIVLNIAEGANKNTNKETRVYINRAHCSLDEVVSCLDCAIDDQYISLDQHVTSLEEASSLAKRLRNFTKYLSS